MKLQTCTILSGLILTTILTAAAPASEVTEFLENAFQHHQTLEPQAPFSDLIEFMQLGYDETGRATRAVAYREIESFKPITGVVVVDFTDEGFILRSASFPDILKIKNGKNRRQVESIIKPIKEISFDPHSGKRAVNTVSGATRYGAKALNYINYMARRAALELEKKNQRIAQ